MPETPFPKLESDVLAKWQQLDLNLLVEKISTDRAKQFVFFDGPPFTNGLPHYGHILAGTIKDAMVRYHLLKGEGVKIQFGWDTHGLPVEYEIEKELGLKSKTDIEMFGIDTFTAACEASVLKYEKEWQSTIVRMGRLGDVEHPYTTMQRDYMESIWWVVKTIYDRGLLTNSFKSLPYCPRCATPLSNFELNQGYKDNIPAETVYVKFKRRGTENSYFLAWTTTPWTLPGNAALAVNPDADYVVIKTDKDEYYCIAKERQESLGIVGEVVVTKSGRELADERYEPLYPEAGDFDVHNYPEGSAYKVVAADWVSLSDGTGIVHVAPAFGEDDLQTGQQDKLPLLKTLDDQGHMLAPEFVNGDWFEKANPKITADLVERNLLFKQEHIEHTYPFCWRCDTPLIYLATPAWFVDVSKVKDQLLANNQKINWVPEHLKDGRFGKWLEGARDWAISRNRYWGNPLPIWHCQACDQFQVFGSTTELQAKQCNDTPLANLHRPYIDLVEVHCGCGGIAKRIPDVLDCWFESGAMPYAHQHFPQDFGGDIEQFMRKKERPADLFGASGDKRIGEETIRQTAQSGRFPATFIAEGLDQTRGWFYTLHVLATILADTPAFENVIVNGLILAKDGKKLSKRLKNYPPVEEIFGQFGADSLRWFLLGSPAVEAEEVRFSSEAVQDVMRKRLMILLNTLHFYTTYSQLHALPVSAGMAWPEAKSFLNRWFVSRVDGALSDIDTAYGGYRLPRAVRALGELVEDLSLWFVRRSRGSVRADAEKSEAVETLTVLRVALLKMAHAILPVAPFFAEHLYQAVSAGSGEKSIQLSAWPETLEVSIPLLNEMANTRLVISHLLRLRQEHNLPVKQPLALAKIDTVVGPEAIQLIKDEVNVLAVQLLEPGEQPPVGKGSPTSASTPVWLDTLITPELTRMAEERELVRTVQKMRKQAGVNYDQSVSLCLITESKSLLEELRERLRGYEERLHLTSISNSSADDDLISESHARSEVVVGGQTVPLILTG